MVAAWTLAGLEIGRADPIESALAIISSFDATGLSVDELAKAVLRTEQLLQCCPCPLRCVVGAVRTGRRLGGRRRTVRGGVDGGADRVGPGWAAQPSAAGRRADAAARRRRRGPGGPAVDGAPPGGRRLRPPPPRSSPPTTKQSWVEQADGAGRRRASGWRPVTGSPPPTRHTAEREPEPSRAPGEHACTPPARSRAGCGSTACSPPTTPTWSRPRSAPASTGPARRPGRRPQRRRPAGLRAAGRRPGRPRRPSDAPRALRRVGPRPLPRRRRRPSRASRPIPAEAACDATAYRVALGAAG